MLTDALRQIRQLTGNGTMLILVAIAADLEQQKSYMTGAPAAPKSLMPAERTP